MDLLQTFASSLDESTWDEINAFLRRYGYLGNEANAMLASGTPAPPLNALRRFQAFYGIREESADELLTKTLEEMKGKRCGVTDFEAAEARQPGCPWPASQNILIYEVENAPAGLQPGEVKAAIGKAINTWNGALQAAGIPLTFRKRDARRRGDSTVHVRFSWKRESGVEAVVGTPIAHADFPPACGLLSRDLPRPVVFNPDVSWSVADSRGPDAFDITAVAVHEIGHILGLPHSDNSTSVMFPALFPGDQPTAEDRSALAKLYAPAAPVPPIAPVILGAGSPSSPAHP